MTTTAIDDWKEVESRGTDGLAVSLLWSKAADRVRGIVADERLDEDFDLDVPSAHALAAFHHPVAYAAVLGLGFGASMRAYLERSAA